MQILAKAGTKAYARRLRRWAKKNLSEAAALTAFQFHEKREHAETLTYQEARRFAAKKRAAAGLPPKKGGKYPNQNGGHSGDKGNYGGQFNKLNHKK